MLKNWCAVVVLSAVLAQKVYGFAADEMYNSTDCDADGLCMKCGPRGCIKCPNLIVLPSRRCVDVCPFGHNPRWSTLVDVMGKMCIHNGNFLGLSSNALAILTGVVTGAVLCAIFVTLGLIYVKFRRKRFPSAASETGSDVEDARDRREFVKQLETLRPYAQSYLEMLNDTRRQLRELHRHGDTGAMGVYKPVLRDLAKILLLLNRPVGNLAVPEDWEHLFAWAEKTLKRYRRMSATSQPQVAQLINFLQGPILPAEEEESEREFSVRGSTTMSTFKPDQIFGSSNSLQDAAIKNFDVNYDSAYNNHGPLNPQWKFEYSPVANNIPPSEFDPGVWKNSREYLQGNVFLDDDFCQLGFRPQDEITTEL